MQIINCHIKIGFLALIMSLVVNFAKAQCTANFSDTSNVCGVVQFTNLSTGTSSVTNYFWDFGNSSPTSTLQSPSGTYTANGTYTVCLFISSLPTCSSSICKTITVSCFTSSLCTANFSSLTCTPSGPNAQLSFSNTSFGTNGSTQYDWDFGNSTTSTLSIPTATYNSNGTYIVCMSYTTYIPAFCTASICKTITIGCVISPSCSAGFNTVSCVASGTNAQVSFINLSSATNSPIVSSWAFGNSTISNATNPTATYTANGTYIVCLSIASGSPQCFDTLCQVITVTCVPVPIPTCQANFTNSPCNNGQITFSSTSTGANGSTAYTWSNSPPPSGPPAPYTATVCLTMVNSSPTCSSSVCKTVLVDCVVGIAEFIFESANIRIFPNPSNGLFTLEVNQINLNSSSIHIKVYNILGELVHQHIEEVQQDRVNKQIDLQSLPNGAYYLRLNTGNNAYSVKLIIAK